jgi:putative MATE family efflux protein
LRAAFSVGVDGVWLAAALGVTLAVVGWVTAAPVTAALGATGAVQDGAVTYLRWSMPGLPAMLIVLAATGVLRGLQDTRTPLAVAISGCAVNAALNLALVHGAGLGLAGSAIGTAITQIGMAAALLIVVGRGMVREGAPLRPHAPGIRAAGRAGIPLLVRTIALRACLLVTVWAAAQHGSAALAAHQVAANAWTLVALALDALAIAAQALTGRALGAADVAAVRAATRRMLVWGVVGGVVLGLGVALVHTLAWRLFTDDPSVAGALSAVLVVIALAAPLAGYVFVLDGVLIGAGDGTYLAWTAVLQFGLYAPLALWAGLATPPVTQDGTRGLTLLWIAFAFGWMVTRAVFLGLRERSDAWLVLGAAR